MAKTSNSRDVYNNLFIKEHHDMSYETFRHKLKAWKKKCCADPDSLSSGTYEGFTAHNATVQVNHNGEVIQAWVKQTADDNGYKELLEIVKDIKPVKIEPINYTQSSDMLEIPLFDMHFGVATLDDYKEICGELLYIISKRTWNEINIIIGQDLIHNNDMRGHTAKGTDILKVNIPHAWKDAYIFWCNVIDVCLNNCSSVKLRYSKGNHDECISWCFLETLAARYPQLIVDDSLKPRKAIVYKQIFVGYGHCQYTSSLDKLFRDFVLDFPQEFANAKVREVHTGHLHRESVDDGLMTRRLSSSKPIEEWDDENGYIGSHKRFQIFHYGDDRLKAIYYI